MKKKLKMVDVDSSCSQRMIYFLIWKSKMLRINAFSPCCPNLFVIDYLFSPFLIGRFNGLAKMIFVLLEVVDIPTHRKKREGGMWREKKWGKKHMMYPMFLFVGVEMSGVLKGTNITSHSWEALEVGTWRSIFY